MRGGGVAGGSSVRLGRVNPVASPGLVGPIEEEPRIRRGGTPPYGMVWYGMVWYGMVWYGMVWYGMVWYGMVWYGMVWYGMVWYGMVWYGMVWYGMVWYGMVWYGMVWYVVVVVVVVEGTQHVPAGEIARHALPGQGAREQSAGVTLAGRVPTTTEGGGGGGSTFRPGGGEGARVAVRGSTCPCDPGSLPRRGGRACAPVRNGGGMGGGMEGPPVRGPAGPRFPLLPAATPPRQGRGLRPVRRWSKGGGGGGGLCMVYPLVPVPVSRVREAARLGRRGGSGLGRARG